MWRMNPIFSETAHFLGEVKCDHLCVGGCGELGNVTGTRRNVEHAAAGTHARASEQRRSRLRRERTSGMAPKRSVCECVSVCVCVCVSRLHLTLSVCRAPHTLSWMTRTSRRGRRGWTLRVRDLLAPPHTCAVSGPNPEAYESAPACHILYSSAVNSEAADAQRCRLCAAHARDLAVAAPARRSWRTSIGLNKTCEKTEAK